MSVAGLFYGALIVGIVAAVWQLICNDRTYRDRLRLAQIIFAAPDWRDRREAFLRVSYGEHLRHRLFLLDPWSLYPPSVFGRQIREDRS